MIGLGCSPDDAWNNAYDNAKSICAGRCCSVCCVYPSIVARERRVRKAVPLYALSPPMPAAQAVRFWKVAHSAFPHFRLSVINLRQVKQLWESIEVALRETASAERVGSLNRPRLVPIHAILTG